MQTKRTTTVTKIISKFIFIAFIYDANLQEKLLIAKIYREKLSFLYLCVKIVQMIQNIIVAIILIFIAVYLIRVIIQFFSKKHTKANKCDGCNGCELANQLKNNCSEKDIENKTQ